VPPAALALGKVPLTVLPNPPRPPAPITTVILSFGVTTIVSFLFGAPDPPRPPQGVPASLAPPPPPPPPPRPSTMANKAPVGTVYVVEEEKV
jgi:hypothetical protein